MRRLSLNVSDEFGDLLEHRAKHNNRSINKEIIWLIEAALAHESDVPLSLLRSIMVAEGGPKPARTETGD